MQKNLCLIVVAIAILSMISVYPVQAITMLDQKYLSALAMDIYTYDWVSITGDATSYLDGDSYLVTFDGRIISGALICNVDIIMPHPITDLSWEKVWGTVGTESMTIIVGGVGHILVSFLIIGIAEWSLNVESSFDSGETPVEVWILAYAGSDVDHDDCELILPWGDNFDDNSIDLTKWEKLEAGGATVAEINQRLELTVPSGGSGWAQSGLVTTDCYPMQNFTVEIDVAKLDSLHEMTLQIGLTKTISSDPHDENDWYRIVKTRHTDNRLVVQRRVDGNKSYLKEIPWADATGKLQILIWDSTIYFYENNILKYSEPYQLSSYDCYIYIFTSTERPDASGTDAFDNFNFDCSVPRMLTIGVTGSGTTVPAPGDSLYDEGTEVSVDAIPGSGQVLDYWKLDGVPDGSADPYTVTMDSDHTLWAYFKPSDGGGGCPILSVHNGTGYVEEGLLDIHNPDGIDQIASHVLIHTPEPVEQRYLLRLTEHPQTYSHLDQVQLFGMLTNGTEVKLPLVSAIHSENGNVKQELLVSDDVRAVMLGEDWNNGTSQYIDLKFVAPEELEIETFTFIIEGHNFPEKEAW